MKKLFMLLACGILGFASAANAQRAVGMRSLVLDDGAGHTVTIQVPGGTPSYVWTLPSGAPPANMPSGTLTNSTLRWNGSNWVENTSFLANAGALTASSLGSTAALTLSSTGGANNILMTPGNGVVNVTGALQASTNLLGAALDVTPGVGKDAFLSGGGTTGSELKLDNSGTTHFSIYNNGNNNLTFANTTPSFFPNNAGSVIATMGSGGIFTAVSNINSSGGTLQTNGVTRIDNSGNGTLASLTLTAPLAIAQGGTGQTAKTAAFDALSPNSTLGDLTYHNGTNNVRLAGNTTAAKQFLSQTGTGVVSAAPVWAAIASADVPWATPGTIGSTTPNTGVFSQVAIGQALGADKLDITTTGIGATLTASNSVGVGFPQALVLSSTNTGTGSARGLTVSATANTTGAGGVDGAIVSSTMSTGSFNARGIAASATNSGTGAATGGDFTGTSSSAATAKGLSVTASGSTASNIGVSFNVSGTSPKDLVGTGSTWSVTSAGAAAFASLNSTPIGGTTAAAGAFTQVGIGQAVGADALDVTGAITATGNINTTGGVLQTNSVTRIANNGDATLGATTATSLNSTPIGGTTRAAGAFTQVGIGQAIGADALDVTGAIAATGNINTTGGVIQTNSVTRIANNGDATLGATTATSLNSTPIGGTTRAAGAFTQVGIGQAVGADALDVTGAIAATGNINTTGGVIQTNSVTRIANNGDATLGATTASSLNSTPIGGTTRAAGAFTQVGIGQAVGADALDVTGAIAATGNINSTGGALQTNSVTRIANNGDATLGATTATSLTTGATLGNGGTPTAGGVYKDNVVRMWGNIPAAGTTANGEFGIASYTHTNGTGIYDITIATSLASTSAGSVVVSSRDVGTTAWANFTAANVIHVQTFSDFGTTAADEAFCIMLVGR